MPEYLWSSENKAFVKLCLKCQTLYQGGETEEESRYILSGHFASAHYTLDGFYPVCRPCVSRANQRRRKGREDCEPEELLTCQEGKCAICSTEISLARKLVTKTKAYVDHDHATGKVRGLLCHRCNSGLGYVEDVKWLHLAQEYLKQRS